MGVCNKVVLVFPDIVNALIIGTLLCIYSQSKRTLNPQIHAVLSGWVLTHYPGPKVYIAHGLLTHLCLLGVSLFGFLSSPPPFLTCLWQTTLLHVDNSGAVNILVWSAPLPVGVKGSAVWDLFAHEDAHACTLWGMLFNRPIFLWSRHGERQILGTYSLCSDNTAKNMLKPIELAYILGWNNLEHSVWTICSQHLSFSMPTLVKNRLIKEHPPQCAGSLPSSLLRRGCLH